MKFLLLLTSICLSGCTSTASLLQSSLDDYSSALQHPASESAIFKDLTAQARLAALDSQKLLSELGLRQLGAAKFEVLQSSETKALACLDVSKTYFEDISGEEIELGERAELLTLEISFTRLANRVLISDFEVVSQGC